MCFSEERGGSLQRKRFCLAALAAVADLAIAALHMAPARAGVGVYGGFAEPASADGASTPQQQAGCLR